jgi:hypothetical protein
MDNKNGKPLSIKLNKYLLPEAKEIQKGNYILWGPKHSIPKELVSALEKSNTHRSIIFSLAHQFAGYGFNTENEVGEKDVVLEGVLKKANRLNESFDDVLSKVAFDFAVFGGFAVELHWNINRDKLVEVYHMDYSAIASGLTDEYDRVTFYYHSTDWSKSDPKTTPIRCFNPETEDGRREAKQILVFKPYYPTKNYYPSPDYYSALKWIEIDHELASYKVNGLKNRFSAGMLVSLNNGVPTEEERDDIEKMMKDNFAGNDNNETIVIDFAEDKDHAATFTAIPTSDSQTKYGNMEDEKVNEILKAHRITNPMLVGVPSPAGFSSNADEIKTSYELYYRYVVQPKQKVLEEKFSYILKYFGFDYKLKINPALPFEIKSQGKGEQVLASLNSLSPLVATKVLEAMTEDEIRALASLPAKEPAVTPAPIVPPVPADNKNELPTNDN